MSHSIISPSAAKRWINCPPSAAINAKYPSTSTPAAEEGTAAHSAGEYFVRQALGKPAEIPKLDPKYDSLEFQDSVKFLINYVLNHKNCDIQVERYLQYPILSTKEEKHGGTADYIVLGNDNSLSIIDFKYGKWDVPAENNYQMMLYAVSALKAFNLCGIRKSIKLAIIQPRVANRVKEFFIEEKLLCDWYENIVLPTAKLALSGKGEFCSGEWCRFCKAGENGECPIYS